MYAAVCTPRFTRAATPAVNLYDNGKEVLLEMELAGASKDQVSLEFADSVLTIKVQARSGEREGYQRLYSERAEGAFERSFRVGEDLDADKVQARFENGLLLVSIQKLEKAQPRKIEIN